MSFIPDQIFSTSSNTNANIPSLAIEFPNNTSQREKATTPQVFDAVQSDDVTHVTALFSEYDVDLTVIDDAYGDTPMHRAAAQGDDEIVKILLGHANNNPAVLEARDRKGWTPLMSATEKPSVPAIISLINAGANTENFFDGENLWKMDRDEWSYLYHRQQLVKALAKAKGDLMTATTLALKKQAHTAALWCIQAGGNALSLAVLHTFLQDGRFEDRSFFIRTHILHSWEEVVRNQLIAFDDLISMLDAAFRLEDATSRCKEFTQKQLIKACLKSTFLERIFVHYALSEDTKAVSILLSSLSYLKSDPVLNALVNIANMRELSEEKRISSMRSITNSMEIFSPDYFFETLLSSNKLEILRLLAVAGIKPPKRKIINKLKNNEQTYNTEKIKILISLGLKPDQVIKLLENNNENEEFAINLANAAIHHFVLDNQKLTDKNVKLQEFYKWLNYDKIFLSGAKALHVDVARVGHFEHVQFLMDANMPTDELLITLGRKDKISPAMHIINMGGDIISAISKMMDVITTHHEEKSQATQTIQEARAVQVLRNAAVQSAQDAVTQAAQASRVARVHAVQVEQVARDALNAQFEAATNAQNAAAQDAPVVQYIVLLAKLYALYAFYTLYALYTRDSAVRTEKMAEDAQGVLETAKLQEAIAVAQAEAITRHTQRAQEAQAKAAQEIQKERAAVNTLALALALRTNTRAAKIPIEVTPGHVTPPYLRQSSGTTGLYSSDTFFG